MGTRTFISPSNVPIYDDGAGNQAVIHTEWVQLPSGLLVAQRADNGGIPLSTSRITTEITDAVLAASGSYIQGWQDAQALAVNFVSGSVYADEAGTLYVDFSEDGTNVYGTSTTTLAFTPTTVGTANGATLPYPVEIPTRYFRFRYVNGATVQGVFQLYQTPVSAWSPRQVGLTGSLVGLPQPTAVTVFSIPYSALTASTTYSAMAQKSLTRAVRQRTFYWTNYTNQPMSSASIKIVDSEFAGGSSNPGYWTEVPFTAIPGAGTYGPYPAIADSLSLPALGVMGDSVIVSFAVGATLPTSGSIVIAVLEG